MKLLIADDESVIREGLLRLDWTKAGIAEVQAVDNGLDALRRFSVWKPDIVLTDIRMAGMNGLQLAQAVNEAGAACKLIILSGYGTFEYAKEAIHSGVFDFLLKPSNPDEIITVVKRAADEILKNSTVETRQAISRQREEIFRTNKEEGTIVMVLSYIEQNYMNDITLQSMSEYLHFTTAYLSRLIKKETSYNFTRILCIVRMVKAAELLSSTNLKVYEICERIGMGEPRYFGQLFSKTFGQTPLEYRKTNKQKSGPKLFDFIKQIK